MDEKTYSVADIMSKSGYSQPTISRWMNKNNIHALKKVKGIQYYSESDVEKFLKRHHSKNKGNKAAHIHSYSSNMNELQYKLKLKDQLLKSKEAHINSLEIQLRDLKKQIQNNKQEFSIRENRLNSKIDEKDKKIAQQVETTITLANKVAELVDQAHQLNLVDKIGVQENKDSSSHLTQVEKHDENTGKHRHWWSILKKSND